jgi:DNA-binding CsgD family transcriptional regulator
MAAQGDGCSWHNSRVAAATLTHALTDLRRLVRASGRSARIPEAAPLIARLIGNCRTLAIERRPAGIAVRLQLADQLSGEGLLTCVIHDATEISPLTQSERAVASHLCEGRTLAQIARLRGVTVNTIKSQVRQIFRKLDVDSRVALVRRLCP